MNIYNNYFTFILFFLFCLNYNVIYHVLKLKIIIKLLIIWDLNLHSLKTSEPLNFSCGFLLMHIYDTIKAEVLLKDISFKFFQGLKITRFIIYCLNFEYQMSHTNFYFFVLKWWFLMKFLVFYTGFFFCFISFFL